MVQVHRVITDQPDLEYGSVVELSSDDSRHLVKVLRLEEGSPIVVIQRNSGNEFNAIVSSLNQPAQVRIIGLKSSKDNQSRIANFIFGLSKGKKNDLICEKACELGARQIILWQSSHSVARIDKVDVSNKLSRWNKIIDSAAKQSGNDFPPSLLIALDLDTLLEQLANTRKDGDEFFICSLAPTAKPINTLSPPSGLCSLVVGPEGDFSQTEERALIDFGFQPISLGPTTLRSETAAIVALAAPHLAWGFRTN